jgi:(p)ppGpp synthase/HD superfamily hydrolase
VDTRKVASSNRTSSFAIAGLRRSDPPGWVQDSPLLVEAYSLAERAHGSQRRATDGRHFLDHVLEVAELLHEAGFDDELVAVGLLHDAVERGTLSERSWEMRLERGSARSSSS